MATRNSSAIQSKSRKRDDILDIASDTFLEKGYVGASVNEMYRQSGISKETFYRYFKNKEHLFLAVVDKELESYWDGLAILNNVPENEDPETTLTSVGSELVSYLFAERIMALRQLIFSERARHPRIGQLYFDHGPTRAYKVLTAYFERERKMGVKWKLRSRTLAENFIALLLHKATLEQQCGIRKVPDKRASRRLAKKVAHGFVSAYLNS
jgi:TetR/AcrR family transcriptional repressor of mexJK operon